MVNEDNVTLHDTASIADCLNKHFGTVGEKLASQLSADTDIAKDPLKYIKKEVQHSIFFAIHRC